MAEGINTDQPVSRRLRLGIVGIGVGASEILPQMEAMPTSSCGGGGHQPAGSQHFSTSLRRESLRQR